MLICSTVVYNIGDLLIQLEVAEDPYFKRQDADVHVEVPITLTQVRVNWGCWVGYMSIVANSYAAALICC
jgi:DnaJ-class molecular chaperone